MKMLILLLLIVPVVCFAQESKMFFNLALEDKPRDLSNWFASWYLSVASHISEMGLDPSDHMYITPENETRTIRFGTLPSGTLAVAQQVYNDCNIDILINSKDWFNTYQQKRMWVYYHEMAHDAFNLDHGEGGELMNAYVPNDKITSLRLYNAIRAMVRYAVRNGKYERGTGFCSSGTVYRKNGTNYVSKRGSVYRDHQSSSSYKRPSSSSSYNSQSIINSESNAVAKARAKLQGNLNSATYSQPKQKTYQEKDPSNFKKYIDEKVDLNGHKHKTEIKSKTEIPLNWIPAIVKENSIMNASPNKSSETLYYLNKNDEIYIKPSYVKGQFIRATKLSENKDGFIEMSMIELK